MANVNEQERTVEEPKPNLYNQRKSWHTPDVMPTDNPQTADSLFVEPVATTQHDESDDLEAAKQVTEGKPSNYKKRYDDLKKHYDSRVSQFKQREQELLAEATANRPEYKAPKSVEELEQFKSEYPDVYEVVETVAHLQSEDKVADLQQRIDAMQSRETEILKREAEKDLVAKHPDFDELRNSDEFHTWAESQPEEIKDWIYNNPNNSSLASKAIDLYKLESGIETGTPNKAKAKSRSQVNDAADMVSTKTTTVETNEPKIWTQEEISALPMDEYDRLEAEIDQAVREGRVRV